MEHEYSCSGDYTVTLGWQPPLRNAARLPRETHVKTWRQQSSLSDVNHLQIAPCWLTLQWYTLVMNCTCGGEKLVESAGSEMRRPQSS